MVSVTVNGKAAGGSPFSVAVREQDPQPWVKLAKYGLQSRVNQFVVHAGKSKRATACTVTMTKAGVAPVSIKVVEAEEEGVFLCRYIPEHVGDYEVRVQLDGVDAFGPLLVHVRKPASGASSWSAGPGLSSAVRGRVNHFTVYACGDDGLPVDGVKCQAWMKPALSSLELQPVPIKVKEQGCGSYLCEYTPPANGDFMISATVDGSAVTGKPPRMKTPRLEGLGAQYALKDRRNEFMVVGKPGQKCEIQLRNNKDQPLEVVVEPVGSSGMFLCKYSPPADMEGDLKLTAMLDGAQVMPNITLKCHRAASAANSWAEGQPKAFAGALNRFMVHARGDDNKPLVGCDCQVAMLPVHPKDLAQVDVKVIDKGDGTFECRYVPTQPGEYAISLRLDNTLIKVSSVAVRALPAATEPWAEGSGLVSAVLGRPNTFNVHTPPNEEFKLAGWLEDPRTKLPVGDVAMNRVGNVFQCSYTPREEGRFEVHVMANGNNPVGNCPAPVLVRKMAVAERSKVIAQINKGEFVVSAFDDRGKPVKGCECEVYLSPKGTGVRLPATVHDNGDGTYSCSYPHPPKDEFAVIARLDGHDVRPLWITGDASESAAGGFPKVGHVRSWRTTKKEAVHHSAQVQHDVGSFRAFQTELAGSEDGPATEKMSDSLLDHADMGCLHLALFEHPQGRLRSRFRRADWGYYLCCCCDRDPEMGKQAGCLDYCACCPCFAAFQCRQCLISTKCKRPNTDKHSFSCCCC